MFPFAVLVLSAVDGGTALTLADVRPGDEVEYAIEGVGSMTLRACERTKDTLSVAVSTARDGGAPPGTWAIDRMVMELPLKPLEPPPERNSLGKQREVKALSVAGGRFLCADFELPGAAHSRMGALTRCDAQELILGGGLVKEDTGWFSSRGYSGGTKLTLKRFGRRVGPCPAWPRLSPSGTRVTGGRTLFETQYEAGSSFLRLRSRELTPADAGSLLIDGARYAHEDKAPYTEDKYLFDVLVHSLEGLPRAGEVEPMTVTLAGREVRVVKVLQRYYLQPGHVADAPLPLFLEELARSAEGLKDLRFWRLSPR